jgi:hypothetical protein
VRHYFTVFSCYFEVFDEFRICDQQLSCCIQIHTGVPHSFPLHSDVNMIEEFRIELKKLICLYSYCSLFCEPPYKVGTMIDSFQSPGNSFIYQVE